MTAPAVRAPRPFARSTERSPQGRAAASDMRVDALTACAVFYVFLAVSRLHQIVPMLNYLRPVLVCAGLAVALLAVDRRMSRRVMPVLRMPTVQWLILLFVWGLLSIPSSLWPRGAFVAIVDHMLKSLLMLIVVITALRGRRDLHRLAIAFFTGTAVYASMILLRYKDTPREETLAYYDPNDFALLAVIALPFGLYILKYAGRTMTRGLAVAGIIVTAMAFVWTQSRGGFLALMATTVFGLFYVSGIPRRSRALMLVVIGLVITFGASKEYWDRMRTIVKNDDDYNLTASSGRLQIWRRGIGYMLERPLFGVGADNFPTAEGTISPLARERRHGVGIEWKAAHNTLIQAGAELGIPGLVFIIAAFTSVLLMLRRAQRRLARDPPMRTLAQICVVSFVGFLVGSMFLSLAYSDMLYSLYAVALGTAKIGQLTAASAT